jgi:integrase/recombinase XerD
MLARRVCRRDPLPRRLTESAEGDPDSLWGRSPHLAAARHTSAVHRLTAWYREGKDVQLLLPQLSVYMGHAHLAATQVYLTMTPELLHEASLRFELYAGREGHHD